MRSKLRILSVTIVTFVALEYGSGGLASASARLLLQASAAPAHAIVVAPEVMAKNCIKMVSPGYPGMARAARVSGNVVLRVTISRSGDVVSAEFVTGHPILVEAAIGTVKEWKYKPYLAGGRAVEVSTQVTVKFDLTVPDRVVSYPNGAPSATPEPSVVPGGLDTDLALNKAFDSSGRLEFGAGSNRGKDWAVDRAGNIYFVNAESHSLFQILAATGKMQSVATKYTVAKAALGLVAVDGSGNVYVDDWGDVGVYKISARTGDAVSLGGAAMAADGFEVGSVYGFTVDFGGNLYISVNGGIRRKSATTGIVTEPVSAEGANRIAGIQFAVDPAGNVYLNGENKIEKISIETGSKMTLAGGTPDFRPGRRIVVREGQLATRVNDLRSDGGLAVDAAGNIYFASRDGFWKIDGKTGLLSRVANRPDAYQAGKFMVDGAGNLYVACKGYVQRFATSQTVQSTASTARTEVR